MKTLYSILVLALLTFSFSIQAQSWAKGSITGEGDIVKEELDVSGFDGVSLGFNGNIILMQGSRHKVVVEAQKNIIDNIKTEVKNGTWKVNYEKNVRRAKPVNVYITMPSLRYAGLSGSGNLRSDGRFNNVGNLDVKLSGSGNLELNVDAGDIETSISGSGNINLSGNANSNEIRISGSGSVNAKEMSVGDCNVSISGSGNVKVDVKGKLEAHISGSGDVYYSGDPNVKSRISGSGDVRSM